MKPVIGHSEMFISLLPDYIKNHVPFENIGKRLIDKTLANQIERWVYTGHKFEEISQDYEK